MLNRRDFLKSAALASAMWPTVGHALSGGSRKFVVLFANGGWDSTFCIDPRVGHPTIDGPEVHEDPTNPDDREYVRTYGDNLRIACNDVKRPAVRAFFDDWSHEVAALNGIWLGSIAHPGCRIRMLTGTNSPRSPDLASIHGHTFIGDKPLGSLDMSGMAMPGELAASSGRTGTSNQITTLLDPSDALRSGPDLPSYPLFVPPETESEAVRQLLFERGERLRGDRGGVHANDRRLDDYDLSLDRSRAFRAKSADVLGSLELGSYTSLPTMADVAVDLLDKEICQSVFLDTNRAWDDHSGLGSQHLSYQLTFLGLHQLIDGLADRGLLGDTTVLVMSEMTRTPKINGDFGKDHWPHGCALAIGGGVRGGHAYGMTNDLMESMPMDLATGDPTDRGVPCRYENFGAGVVDLLGGDVARWFPGITPFTGWRA